MGFFLKTFLAIDLIAGTLLWVMWGAEDATGTMHRMPAMVEWHGAFILAPLALMVWGMVALGVHRLVLPVSRDD